MHAFSFKLYNPQGKDYFFVLTGSSYEDPTVWYAKYYDNPVGKQQVYQVTFRGKA